MTSPLEQCRDALAAMLRHYVELVDSGDAGNWDAGKEPKVISARAALAAADAALAAQPEPVAWAQLGMRNGHTYVRMNYEGHLYPPPADVQRNLNLVPLYAAPKDAQGEPPTDRAQKYASQNPLGGPANVFYACADAILAGDPIEQAMANFGLAWAPKEPA